MAGYPANVTMVTHVYEIAALNAHDIMDIASISVERNGT
jgi:hypothetical protein